MKYYEQDRVNQTEEVTVYKLGSEGARGATGPAGTIGTLDTLDAKPVVVATDLALTGDSADSFTNKKSTWQQIIDSVLSGLWQPISTALSKITEAGGLPLWDGGPWPGGGGGGEWTEIQRETVITPVTYVTFDDDLTDDYDQYRIRVRDVIVDAGGLGCQFGYGAVPTWHMANNFYHYAQGISGTSSNSGVGAITADLIKLHTFFAADWKIFGKLFIDNARVSGENVMLTGSIQHKDPTVGQARSAHDQLALPTYADPVDHIRFMSQTTGKITAGTFILEGRND